MDWACSRQAASSDTVKSKVTNGKRGDYQPPEMMKGEIGNYTDVFGVGATLLWILTSRTPAAKALVGQGRTRSVDDLMEIVAPKLEPIAVGAGGGEGGSEVVRDLCAIIAKACREAHFLEKFSLYRDFM